MSAHPPAIPRVQFPAALEGLFRAARYKVLHGGRGATKSWGVARALIILAAERQLRILCAREIQRTIADSVHRLLRDQIEAMGYGQHYTVHDADIVGLNGSLFLFAGLRHLDAHKIKSLEGIDIAWVEEAHSVTKRSWDLLIPTIRKPDSEIWVTFNPELDSDETYRRFVVNPPPGAWVRKVTWRDNPWFPGVLEAERRHAERTDPDGYPHTWEGEPRSAVEGAIYGREMLAMQQERRIRPVPYDPSLPVWTVWDLGWNDLLAIAWVQRGLAECRIIDYEESSFRSLTEWAKVVRGKPYVYAGHWLPPDARAERLESGGRSTASLLRPLLAEKMAAIDTHSGMRVQARSRLVRIVPAVSVEDGIKRARMLLPRTYIDEDRCTDLIEHLRRYRRRVPVSTGEPGSPVHDEHSHGADVVRYLSIVVDQLAGDVYSPHDVREQRVNDAAVGY